jgi:WD40 repeat protein
LIFALRVAPDGRTFATGGTSPEVYVRRLNGGEEKRLSHGDRQGCWALAYAPNGKTLAVGLGSGLQLWDLTKGKLRGELTDPPELVSGVAFSPEGGRLLTCGWDGVARLYAFDAASGVVLREVGRYDWKVGRLFDVAISPDGTLAAAGGNEAPYLVVWDVE